MTGPTYGNVVPAIGRYGSIGIGRQTGPGVKAAPSHFFRYNGGSAMNPQTVRTRDNYANASLFTMAERTQGRTFQGKSINFEVEHAGLILLCELILGSNLTAGVITPNQLNFDRNMPLPPVTVEANIPGNPIRSVDAQFHNLSLTMNQRANFTGTAGFQGITADDMTDPAPAILPVQNVYQFRDHFIKYGSTNLAPEASTLSLDVPIAPIDGARGNQGTASDNIFGFERNGPIALTGQFSLPGVPRDLLAAYQNGQFASFEWVLRKYAADRTTVTKEFRVIIPNAELNMVEPPSTLDRIVTPITWTAVSLANEVPFTIAAL